MYGKLSSGLMLKMTTNRKTRNEDKRMRKEEKNQKWKNGCRVQRSYSAVTFNVSVDI